MTLLKKILNAKPVKKVKQSKYAVKATEVVIEQKKKSNYASNPKLKPKLKLVKV